MSSLRDRLRRQLGSPEELRARALHPDDRPEPDEEGEPGEPAVADAPTEPIAVGSRLASLMRARSARAQLRHGARKAAELGAASERAKEREAVTEGLRRRVRPSDPSRPVTRAPEIERTVVRNGEGACLLGELRLPPDHRHGGVALSDALGVDGAAAMLLSGDAQLADFDPTRALFFDLETTGLMGGSGNLAFVIGGARVLADGSTRLFQLMLRAPGDEAAALVELNRELESVDCLVSFNGKSFDRNVLADRFTMNRMDPDPVLEMPHLDLLHPARRLFRGTLPRCNLASLEESRLGVYRDELEEISGADVPERWFRYLREGRDELLQPVLDHNALDVMTLATLSADLQRCVVAPGAALPEPRALVAAARLLLDRGAPERALEVLQMVARGPDADPVVYGALAVWGEHLRRQGRHEEALPLWSRMRAGSGHADPEPWRRAAIALEWTLGRPAEALALVDGFLAGLDRERDAALAPEAGTMERRRDRLKRRLRQA